MSFEANLKKVYESAGKEQTLQCLSDAIVENKLNVNSFSLRRLFETFCGGSDWHNNVKSGMLYEGPEAVSSSAAVAVGITGQLYLSIIKQAYELAKSPLADMIPVRPVSNQNLGPEVVGYVSSPLNTGAIVEEGQEIPATMLSPQSVTLPNILKWSRIMNLSWEAVYADKTGQMVSQAQEIGNYVKVERTKNIVNTVLGYLATYTFNGVSYSTYYTAADANIFTNKVTSFSIDSLDSINTLETLIRNQKDPYSNQPIEMLDGQKTVLIVPAAKYKVSAIINGLGVRYGNYNASTDRYATEAGNPLVSSEYNIVADQWVKNILTDNAVSTSDQANFMLLGNFQKAFLYREARPLTVEQLPVPNTWSFSQDIITSFRAVHMGSCGVEEPRALALGVVS